jgi:hypothetical protein
VSVQAVSWCGALTDNFSRSSSAFACTLGSARGNGGKRLLSLSTELQQLLVEIAVNVKQG